MSSSCAARHDINAALMAECHDEAIAGSMAVKATLDVSQQYSGNALPVCLPVTAEFAS
jgi:hypothetical protein